MDILLGTLNGNNQTFDRLRGKIEDIVPTGGLRICHSIRDLTTELRRPSEGYRIIILLARNTHDLEGYSSLMDLLKDISLILILPDLEKLTVLEGYKFYPRFTSHMESDFKDVAAVLVKMICHMRVKYSRFENRDPDGADRIG